MTAQNTSQQQRFDMYTTVHKGLRAFMADTLTAVGRVDPGDMVEVANGIARTRALIDICRDHLHHENRFIHPAMESRRPGSAVITAIDHVQHEEAFERLTGEVLAVERSSSTEERQRALLKLYRGLSIFVADNFIHMNVEEIYNNAAMWELYNDGELLAIYHDIVSAVAPEKMAVYLRWIIPSLSFPERVGMLGGMRRTMPDEVFGQILQIVEPALSRKDWAKLTSALGVELELEAVAIAS